MNHNHDHGHNHNNTYGRDHGGKRSSSDQAEQAMLEQAQAKMRALFAEMPRDVPLVLFSTPGTENVFTKATRDIIRVIQNLRLE